MGVRTEDVAAVGRRVAAHEDAALERLVRPSTDERLLAVYRKEATLALQPRPAPVARRVGFALAACAAALGLFFALSRPGQLPPPGQSLTYQIEGSPGAVGRWVAANTAWVGLD